MRNWVLQPAEPVYRWTVGEVTVTKISEGVLEGGLDVATSARASWRRARARRCWASTGSGRISSTPTARCGSPSTRSSSRRRRTASSSIPASATTNTGRHTISGSIAKSLKASRDQSRCGAANRVKSKIRARVEHVFAQQKAHTALFIRTIGIKRAEAKITLANLAHNPEIARQAAHLTVYQRTASYTVLAGNAPMPFVGGLAACRQLCNRELANGLPSFDRSASVTNDRSDFVAN